MGRSRPVHLNFRSEERRCSIAWRVSVRHELNVIVAAEMLG
jgi:hypothetical protein